MHITWHRPTGMNGSLATELDYTIISCIHTLKTADSCHDDNFDMMTTVWMTWWHNDMETLYESVALNTLRPGQNGSHFPDNIFKCIFFNENIWILIEISLMFVPRGPINNISSLVQIMAWHLNQWCLVYWRIYAALCLNELVRGIHWSDWWIPLTNGQWCWSYW